jgi:putative ubiquitin-RnfH superfamily antitoxin RatB of RatAB toxin-antitoxin module
MADAIRVEVACTERGRAVVRTVSLPAGATAAEAIAASGLQREWPEVAVAADGIGIFGRRVPPQRVLRDGDRVEVYRPLLLDPMQARRRRAG